MSSSGNKVGRPRKSAIASKKKGGRGKVGRPKGDKAILDEYKARMLNSPKSRRVLDAILNAALDDDHKNQAVAWKIVADRILPVSGFDPEKNKGNGGLQISISTTNGNVEVASSAKATTDDSDDAIDADYTEVNE